MGSATLLQTTYLQDFICTMLSDADPTGTFRQSINLPLALHVSPNIDVRRLERAYARLQMRHDVFRLSFPRTKQGWRARVHDQPRSVMRVTDHGEAPVDGFAAALAPLLAPEYDVSSDPLISLDLLRFGAAGDVVLLQISHLLSDGHGLVIAIEDLISFFLNLPVSGTPLGFAEYMRTCFQQSPARVAEGWDYWTNLLLPPAPPVKFGLVAKGIDPLEHTQQAGQGRAHRVLLDRAATEAIQLRARTLGCTAFALAAAAFYGAVRDASGATELNVATVLGRNDARLELFAGCHIDILEMICRERDGTRVSDQARALNRQIRQSMPHLPHPATLPNSTLAQQITAQGGHARRFQVRLAHAEAREARSHLAGILMPKDHVLRLGQYQARMIPLQGSASARELIVVQSAVPDGLRLDLIYDGAGFTEAEIGDFGSNLAELLQRGE